MNTSLFKAFALLLVFGVGVFADEEAVRKDWNAISIKNNGGFQIRFEVRYYDSNGNLKVEGSGKYQVGQSRSLLVEPGARNVIIKCELNTFINHWSTVFVRTLDYSEVKCFAVAGVTVKPSWKEVGC